MKTKYTLSLITLLITTLSYTQSSYSPPDGFGKKQLFTKINQEEQLELLHQKPIASEKLPLLIKINMEEQKVALHLEQIPLEKQVQLHKIVIVTFKQNPF